MVFGQFIQLSGLQHPYWSSTGNIPRGLLWGYRKKHGVTPMMLGDVLVQHRQHSPWGYRKKHGVTPMTLGDVSGGETLESFKPWEIWVLKARCEPGAALALHGNRTLPLAMNRNPVPRRGVLTSQG
ncbi:hypothetical protein P7K49_023841, partial [Saguinus oedipus]